MTFNDLYIEYKNHNNVSELLILNSKSIYILFKIWVN